MLSLCKNIVLNREPLRGEPDYALLAVPRLVGPAIKHTGCHKAGQFTHGICSAYGPSVLCAVRFHSVLFPQYSVPNTAITSEPVLLRLITLISAVRVLTGNQVKSLRSLPSGGDCLRLRDAQCRKNRLNESTANGTTRGGESVSYKIVAYKNGKKIGSMRDHTGKVMVFKTKQEAETTKGIESLQIESVGLNLEIVQIRQKAGKR